MLMVASHKTRIAMAASPRREDRVHRNDDGRLAASMTVAQPRRSRSRWRRP
jgi:hypothetical protein